ncbi:hypothetical protein QBC32DRAFT_19551 [Pseudoneurospora amorphoporcata]|uniref:Secreted protein n=1 Tax=Pseudoneurospora amorphoporcata TaxID=241081 RepID=A0AAN6NSE1_9PEZI|nr:hypothetical protein QBC32DRAFT_19551 [Pseudoneurospora amorphoporcata]
MASLAAGSLAFLTVLGFCALSVLCAPASLFFLGVAQPRGRSSEASRACRKDPQEPCVITVVAGKSPASRPLPEDDRTWELALCTRHMTSLPTTWTRLSTPAFHHHHYERAQSPGLTSETVQAFSELVRSLPAKISAKILRTGGFSRFHIARCSL